MCIRDRYKGEVDLAAFTAFYEECAHPLVYNGDLLTVEDIRKVDEEFPRLEGVMLGRGSVSYTHLSKLVTLHRECTFDIPWSGSLCPG